MADDGSDFERDRLSVEFEKADAEGVSIGGLDDEVLEEAVRRGDAADARSRFPFPAGVFDRECFGDGDEGIRFVGGRFDPDAEVASAFEEATGFAKFFAKVGRHLLAYRFGASVEVEHEVSFAGGDHDVGVAVSQRRDQRGPGGGVDRDVEPPHRRKAAREDFVGEALGGGVVYRLVIPEQTDVGVPGVGRERGGPSEAAAAWSVEEDRGEPTPVTATDDGDADEMFGGERFEPRREGADECGGSGVAAAAAPQVVPTVGVFGQ